MTTIKIAALAAMACMVMPAAAQTNMQVDAEKARIEQAKLITDKDVHWTHKQKLELLMNAPYLRPLYAYELESLFRTLPANQSRVLFEGLTNAIRANATPYWERKMAWDTYWAARAAGRMDAPIPEMTTTTTTVTRTGGDTTVTKTVETADTSGMRPQVIVTTSMFEGLSAMEAWELVQRDLDAEDRGIFRNVWDGLTSVQRDAIVETVRNSSRYYAYRLTGRYGWFVR